MKLRNVSIDGFRSIRSLNSLNLGTPTILAGHNDAGKSAIIDAILMLLGSYKPTIEDLGAERTRAGSCASQRDERGRRL
ncbi:AAA family ATPase [Microbacterium sp. USHLN186]|uniref:AAA family ATPase n=1 Tax=Microbacterium sp. USHLN186 TaxID=3081286 RepID=UPI003FA59299